MLHRILAVFIQPQIPAPHYYQMDGSVLDGAFFHDFGRNKFYLCRCNTTDNDCPHGPRTMAMVID
jgi:hypothetical protein